MNYCKFLYVIFFLPIICLGQKKIEPDSKSIITAKKIAEAYPDSDVALTKSYQKITFNYYKDKVTVLNKTQENLLNLKSRSDIQRFAFYDGMSAINAFNISYKNKKKASFYIKDEAYTSSDLFHNDTRIKYVKIDFPLKAYEYNIEIEKYYKDIKYFTSLYFNDVYPIKKKTVEIVVPSWLNIEFKEINFQNAKITKTKKTNPKNGDVTYTYIYENIEPIIDEENAPGPSYIYPHLLVLAKSHTKEKTETKIFKTTKDQYNWYKKLVNSLKNDKTPYKSKVEELTKKTDNDDEKIKNIYYWIQDNIRYIAFEDGIAGFKPDEAHNVFNKRYGDCKGMANLTKAMLKVAGFDARLAWIGTKRIAYDYSTPNLAVDNHMICTLFNDGKIIYLDATEKFNAFGEYANRIQDKQIMIENGDDFILKQVPTNNYYDNTETVTYNLKLENELLIGNAVRTNKGENRAKLLYYFNTIKNDKKEDFLEFYLNKGDSNIEVSEINTSNLKNRDENISINYNITLKDRVSSFDGVYYIDLDLDKEFANFDFSERSTDYVFSYKRHLISKTILEIQPGYKISELPKKLNINTPNIEFDIYFISNKNTITYIKEFKLKTGKIPVSEFETFKENIKKINNIYNEQITLSK